MSTDLEDRPINVKRLTLPDAPLPASEHFDINDFLTSEDWLVIREEIEGKESYELIQNLRHLAILNPEQAQIFDTDRIWQKVTDSIYTLKILRDVASATIFSPSRARRTNIGRYVDWDKEIEKFAKSSYYPRIKTAINAKIVDPTRSESFPIVDRDYEQAGRDVVMALAGPNLGTFETPIEYLEYLRLSEESIFREAMSNNPTIIKKFWENANHYLRNMLDEGNFTDILPFASGLTIIAADSVKIADRGLEIQRAGERITTTSPIQIPTTLKY